MKRKYLFFLILLIIISFCLSGCELNSQNNQNNEHNENGENNESANNVEISRTNLELNTTNSITNDTSTNNHSNNSEDSSSDDDKKNDSSADTDKNDDSQKVPVETELATFSTTIIDKRENRQNNIRLTCSKLNNFTVDSGQTFSFLKTIGETTAEARI